MAVNLFNSSCCGRINHPRHGRPRHRYKKYRKYICRLFPTPSGTLRPWLSHVQIGRTDTRKGVRRGARQRRCRFNRHIMFRDPPMSHARTCVSLLQAQWCVPGSPKLSASGGTRRQRALRESAGTARSLQPLCPVRINGCWWRGLSVCVSASSDTSLVRAMSLSRLRNGSQTT